MTKKVNQETLFKIVLTIHQSTPKTRISRVSDSKVKYRKASPKTQAKRIDHLFSVTLSSAKSSTPRKRRIR